MIKNIDKKSTGIEIDLTGPQGNAFFLLGTAQQLGKELDYTKDRLDLLINDMKSGDYENLVNVFDENFGSFVTLYRWLTMCESII